MGGTVGTDRAGGGGVGREPDETVIAYWYFEDVVCNSRPRLDAPDEAAVGMRGAGGRGWVRLSARGWIEAWTKAIAAVGAIAMLYSGGLEQGILCSCAITPRQVFSLMLFTGDGQGTRNYGGEAELGELRICKVKRQGKKRRQTQRETNYGT